MTYPIRNEEGGAVVVEFAIVFVLFITLLWGLMMYGEVFAIQQSLSHAAAEGARAGVGFTDTNAAEDHAVNTAAQQLSWVPTAGITTNDAEVVDCEGEPEGSTLQCLVVNVAFDTDEARIPALFKIMVPPELSARASIVHGEAP